MNARKAEMLPREAGWIRRWAFKVGAVLLLLVLALCGVYLAREQILAPFVISRASTWVREATGLDLELDSLGGNWWNEVELRGLRLSGATPTGELTSLSAGRLKLRFALLDLIQGDLGAIESVEIGSANVSLDLDRPGAPSVGVKQPASPALPFPWPLRVPAITARDVNVAMKLGGGSKLEARGLSVVSIEPAAAGTTEWEVRAQHGSLSDKQFGDREASIHARISYRAGVFEMPRLDFDEHTLARNLSCDLRNVNHRGSTSVAGILDLFGGAQEFHLAVDADELALWLDTHELDLASLLHELRVAPAWSGRASVGGVLHVPFAAPANWCAWAWGKVDAPAFEDRQFDLATFAGSFDSEQIEIREGALVRGANTLSFSKFGLSLAETDLDDILRSLSGSAELEVFDPRAILFGASPQVQDAADRVQIAKLAASFSPSGMAVRSGVIETDLGGLSIQRGRAKWGAGDLPWYEGLGLDLDLALDFVDIAPLAALFNQGVAHGALAGTVQLRGQALRPSGNFVLAGEGLEVHGLKLGRVTIEARADKQQLEIGKLELDGALGQASASGKFDYQSGVISNARVSARTSALDILSDQRASAALAVVDASVEGLWREPGIWAHARAWSLDVGKHSIEELDVEGVYGDGCARIQRLQGSIENVAVDASGSVCQDAASGSWSVGLDRARLAREGLDLALEAPLELTGSPDKFTVRGLCVAGSAGRAIADISWSHDEQDVSIEASELYPMQLLRPFLPSGVEFEGVQGSLTLLRTTQTLSLNAALSVADLRPYADSPPASLAFQGALLDRELVITQLTLSAPSFYELNVSGRVPTDPLAGEWLSDGPLELFGEGSVSNLSSLPWNSWGLQSSWSGDVHAAFRLAGTSTNVHGVIDANLDVARSAADSILDRAQLNAFHFEGRARLGTEISLDDARFSVPGRASAIVDGRLGLRVKPRDWLREMKIDWRSAPVELTARVSAQDLGFIAGLSSSLRRNGGSLEGDLCLAGPLGNPLITGALDLLHGEVRLSNSMAAVENLSAHFEFDDRILRVESMHGDYGAAPFTASGTVDMGGEEPHFDFHVEGKGLLLAREEGLRLRADADLKIAGPLNALDLSGAVVIVEGRFSKEFELLSLPGSSRSRRARELELPFLRQAPWANITFDVEVRAQKPIRVETNLARGTVDPRLRLQGSGAAPRLSGTLAIGTTRVKLPATTLDVTSGVLRFRGESSLAPDLDITAITRVRGYDITAQIGGTSVDPEILFTSSPPLSSEELAVLVLTGQLPESALSATGSESAAQTVAVYLGRDLLTRWLGVEEGSEDPISERLEFYRGAEVSQTGIESTEFIFRLTPNPKSKSTILYLRAEKDIYERVNYGVKFLFRFR